MSGRARATVPFVAALCAALLLGAASAQAGAPSLAQITVKLRSAAQYDDPAAKVTKAQRTAIDRAIDLAQKKKRVVRVAVLSAVPPDAPRTTAAPRLRSRLKLAGTVIVALPDSVQIASLNVSGAKLAQVRRAVEGKGGPLGARAAISALLAKPKPPVTTNTTTTGTTTTPAAGGGKKKHGTSTTTYALIAAAAVIVLIALILTALRARTRKVRRRGGGTLLTAARSLLQGRLEGLGEGLAATAVGVSEREDRALTEHHQTASEIVSDVRGSIGRLDGPPAFRRAHAELDDAEWHLGVVQSHLDGTGEPPRPEAGHPARCFFDVEHGLATVNVELEIPGVRTVTVGVCAEDALRLSRAEEPEVGAVSVGRRRLPWAAAPTWFGGWGWGQDDLPALRYHGAPVFVSRTQLDQIEDPAAPPRSITVRPMPSTGDTEEHELPLDEDTDEGDEETVEGVTPLGSLETDPTLGRFVPDDETIVVHPARAGGPAADDADADEEYGDDELEDDDGDFEDDDEQLGFPEDGDEDGDDEDGTGEPPAGR
jgi:hypothetical protein